MSIRYPSFNEFNHFPKFLSDGVEIWVQALLVAGWGEPCPCPLSEGTSWASIIWIFTLPFPDTCHRGHQIQLSPPGTATFQRFFRACSYHSPPTLNCLSIKSPLLTLVLKSVLSGLNCLLSLLTNFIFTPFYSRPIFHNVFPRTLLHRYTYTHRYMHIYKHTHACSPLTSPHTHTLT